MGQDFLAIQYVDPKGKSVKSKNISVMEASVGNLPFPMVLILDGSSEHGAHINQVFRFVEGIWIHQKSR